LDQQLTARGQQQGSLCTSIAARDGEEEEEEKEEEEEEEDEGSASLLLLSLSSALSSSLSLSLALPSRSRHAAPCTRQPVAPPLLPSSRNASYREINSRDVLQESARILMYRPRAVRRLQRGRLRCRRPLVLIGLEDRNMAGDGNVGCTELHR